MKKKSLINFRVNSLVVMLAILIMGFAILCSSVYADQAKVIDNKTWIQFEKYSGRSFPIAILYEGQELELLNENHLSMQGPLYRVEFMIDDFAGTPINAWDTAIYNNRYLKNSAYINNYKMKIKKIGSKRALICSFERDTLKYAPNLDTQFLYIDIEIDNKTLVSVYFKSKDEIDIDECLAKIIDCSVSKNKYAMAKSDDVVVFREGLYDELLNGEVPLEMQNEDVESEVVISKNISIKKPEQHIKKRSNFIHEGTSKFYREDLFGEGFKFKWGIFEPMSNVSFKMLQDIEQNTCMNFDILLEYYHVNSLPISKHISDVNKNGKILELTFQTSIISDFKTDMVYDILSGKEDESINQLLTAMKESDVPILFRLNNEMNGDWCNYNALYYHKDPEVFVEFWRWFKKECQNRGVNNLIWVWNPNWGDFPKVKWNNYMRYFPGQSYVDIIGLTGYNTGTYYKHEHWRTFDEIYSPMIEDYQLHFLHYPYIITEFGCADMGGNKAQWIRDALRQLSKLPVKGAVWWNGIDRDPSSGKIARKYRFDDDPESVLVFKEYMEEEN